METNNTIFWLITLTIVVCLAAGLVIGYFIGRFRRRIVDGNEENSPWYATRIVFSNNQTIGGTIMEVNAQIDQTFLILWKSLKDKGGNPAAFEQLEFFSDDETRSMIRQATQAEVDAYNSQFPEEGEGSENRVPIEDVPFTGRVATSTKVGATSVGIRADKKVGEAVEKVESRVTITNLPGEAVGGFEGEPRVTTPVDNLETEG